LLQNTLDLQIFKFSSFLSFALKLPKPDTLVFSDLPNLIINTCPYLLVKLVY
jgi:hypothetical protein